MRTFLPVLTTCLLMSSAALAQQAEQRPEPVPTSDGTSGGAAAQPVETTSGRSTGQPAPAPPPPPPAPPPREEEGDGRAADILWIEAGFGYSYANLIQFSSNNFIPSADELNGSGYMATLAAGFRISILTLGARGSLASYSGFDVGTAVFDVALRLPLPTIEPYIRGGIGYGWIGDANYDEPSMSDTSVYGLVGEAGAGLDIYFDKVFAIGGGIDAAFLNLARQRADQCTGTMDPNCMIDTVNFEEDGDAVGLQLRVQAHASLHF